MPSAFLKHYFISLPYHTTQSEAHSHRRRPLHGISLLFVVPVADDVLHWQAVSACEGRPRKKRVGSLPKGRFCKRQPCLAPPELIPVGSLLKGILRLEAGKDVRFQEH